MDVEQNYSICILLPLSIPQNIVAWKVRTYPLYDTFANSLHTFSFILYHLNSDKPKDIPLSFQALLTDKKHQHLKNFNWRPEGLKEAPGPNTVYKDMTNLTWTVLGLQGGLH